MSTLKSQTVRGLKWQAVEIAGRQLLSLAVFTILARLLDPTDFGLLGMVAVYLAFVALFVEQGIGAAIIQRKDLEPEHLDSAFWFSVGCAVVLTAVTIALAGPVALLFDEPRLAPLLRWGSLTLIAGALSGVHIALFVRDMDFRRPAMRTILANLGGGVVGVWMALSGCGVWALIGQQLAASVVSAIFVWIASPWVPRLHFSMRHLRDLFSISGAVLATGLLWFVSSRADQFFIGRLLGTSALGYYTVGCKLPEMVKVALHQPIASVSLPALSKMHGDKERLADAVYQGMRFVSLISFPVLIGLAAIAPTAVPLLFGGQWFDSIIPLRLFALYTLVNLLQVFYNPLLIATGGSGSYLVLNVLHVGGTIVACVVGVQFGIGWLVLGLLLNASVVGVLAFGYLQHRIGLKAGCYWASSLVPATAAVLMATVVHYISLVCAIGAVSLLAQVIGGAATYAGVIAAIRPARLSEVVALICQRPLSSKAVASTAS